MSKLTKTILLNALLLACSTAAASITVNEERVVETLEVEKKARNGHLLHTAMVEHASPQHKDIFRPVLTELHNGEKSKLFKKLPDHLIAGNQ